jgi:hypothetical protein
MSKNSETLRTEIPDLPEVAELSEEQLQVVEGGMRPITDPGPANPSFHYPSWLAEVQHLVHDPDHFVR